MIDPSQLCINSALTMPVSHQVTNNFGSQLQIYTGIQNPPQITDQQLKEIRAELQTLYDKLRTSKTRFAQMIGPLDQKLDQYNQYRDQPQNPVRNTAPPPKNTSIDVTVPMPPNLPSATPAKPPPEPVRPPKTPIGPSHQHGNKNSSQKTERNNRRSADRNSTTSTTNNLDVWVRAEHFFQNLMTEQEAQELFPGSTPPPPPSPAPFSHWSIKFKDLVDNAKQTNERVLMPPGPPPSPSDRNEYWRQNDPPFAIEKLQLSNCSTLHCLLSSFLEINPLPESTKNDFQSKMKVHPLIPILPFSDYLSHPFADRLSYELECVGLDKPAENVAITDEPFAKEIQSYQDTLDGEVLPLLEKLKQKLLKELPTYIADQNKRKEKLKNYQELLVKAKEKERAKGRK